MAYQPNYVPESPFAFTPIIGRYLTYYVHRRVPPHALDTIITLDLTYEHRPDLLANDLYGDPDLFWVIAERNGLQDPIYGFKGGKQYVIPHPSFVRKIV